MNPWMLILVLTNLLDLYRSGRADGLFNLAMIIWWDCTSLTPIWAIQSPHGLWQGRLHTEYFALHQLIFVHSTTCTYVLHTCMYYVHQLIVYMYKVHVRNSTPYYVQVSNMNTHTSMDPWMHPWMEPAPACRVITRKYRCTYYIKYIVPRQEYVQVINLTTIS